MFDIYFFFFTSFLFFSLCFFLILLLLFSKFSVLKAIRRVLKSVRFEMIDLYQNERHLYLNQLQFMRGRSFIDANDYSRLWWLCFANDYIDVDYGDFSDVLMSIKAYKHRVVHTNCHSNARFSKVFLSSAYSSSFLAPSQLRNYPLFRFAEFSGFFDSHLFILHSSIWSNLFWSTANFQHQYRNY